MIKGKTDAETIKLTARALGISEQQAAVIVAIETGESTGDVVYVDDDGNEVAGPPAKQIDED